MIKEKLGVTVHILGMPFEIKCPETEVYSLQRAATFLDEKMRTVRENNKGLSLDRMAVIVALNITHELLNFENKTNDQMQVFHQHIRDLQYRVETALAEHSQLELSSAK